MTTARAWVRMGAPSGGGTTSARDAGGALPVSVGRAGRAVAGATVRRPTTSSLAAPPPPPRERRVRPGPPPMRTRRHDRTSARRGPRSGPSGPVKGRVPRPLAVRGGGDGIAPRDRRIPRRIHCPSIFARRARRRDPMIFGLGKQATAQPRQHPSRSRAPSAAWGWWRARACGWSRAPPATGAC